MPRRRNSAISRALKTALIEEARLARIIAREDARQRRQVVFRNQSVAPPPPVITPAAIAEPPARPILPAAGSNVPGTSSNAAFTLPATDTSRGGHSRLCTTPAGNHVEDELHIDTEDESFV